MVHDLWDRSQAAVPTVILVIFFKNIINFYTILLIKISKIIHYSLRPES